MKRVAAVTFMELIVVMVVIALLAVIAYPNFVRMKLSTRRADAQASVNATYSIVERYLAENNKANITSSDLDLDQFSSYKASSTSPIISNAGYYKVTIVPETDGYSVNAIAIADGTTSACSTVSNAETLDQCADSTCWTISIVNGAKQSTNSTGVVADANTTSCW